MELAKSGKHRSHGNNVVVTCNKHEYYNNIYLQWTTVVVYFRKLILIIIIDCSCAGAFLYITRFTKILPIHTS